jgi:hypothetical protein
MSHAKPTYPSPMELAAKAAATTTPPEGGQVPPPHQRLKAEDKSHHQEVTVLAGDLKGSSSKNELVPGRGMVLSILIFEWMNQLLGSLGAGASVGEARGAAGRGHFDA